MYAVITKILLAPILLIQGLYVRGTITRLPEPEGQREGIKGCGNRLRLLILGDSAAAGVGVEHQSHALAGNLVATLEKHFELHWMLYAQTGESTDSILSKLNQRVMPDFDVALISLGVNDTTSGKSTRKFENQTLALIDLLRTKCAISHIIFTGLPPMGEFPALPQPLRWFLGYQSRELDRSLNRITSEQQCHYLKIDLEADPSLVAADGFHPGAKAYLIWAKRAGQLIRQLVR